MKKTLIIGVTGGSASGKTSVSHAILETFSNERIAMIEHDSYYKDQSHLTFEERTKTNYDHPLAVDADLDAYHDADACSKHHSVIVHCVHRRFASPPYQEDIYEHQ